MVQPTPPASTHQPALITVELGLKDGLRALKFNLRQGAHWLVDDVGPRLARQIDPVGIEGKRKKIHVLVDSAAKGTLSTLEAMQHLAAPKAMADKPYRALDFELLSLAVYISSGDERNPSGLFAEVFYWLIRHALALGPDPGPGWLVSQLAVDEAFWQLQTSHDGSMALAVSAAPTDQQQEQQHARRCARLLRALIVTRPVRDASMPPWTQTHHDPADTPEMLRVLLSVVLAVGSVTPAGANTSRAAACLHMGWEIAGARQAAFSRALSRSGNDDAAALADEFAFVLRHI